MLRAISFRSPSDLLLSEVSIGPDKRVHSSFIKPLKQLPEGPVMVALQKKVEESNDRRNATPLWETPCTLQDVVRMTLN